MERKIILALTILLFISCTFFIFSIVNYIKKYHIIKLIIAKIKKSNYEIDHIHRMNIKEDAFSYTMKTSKISLIDKLYILIRDAGVIEQIPGFSEISFISIVLTLDILMIIVVTIIKGIFFGALIGIVGIFLCWYILNYYSNKREEEVNDQLILLSDTIAQTSAQYGSLIDIFGGIYNQFEGPLRTALQDCYVEAKKTNNSRRALENLKSRFSSKRFAFIIDSFMICDNTTSNFRETAKKITANEKHYQDAHNKILISLRNARISIVVLAVLCILIMYYIAVFFGGSLSSILNSTIGECLCAAYVIIFLCGINIKEN